LHIWIAMPGSSGVIVGNAFFVSSGIPPPAASGFIATISAALMNGLFVAQADRAK
jgi:hypothetical protein